MQPEIENYVISCVLGILMKNAKLYDICNIVQKPPYFANNYMIL